MREAAAELALASEPLERNKFFVENLPPGVLPLKVSLFLSNLFCLSPVSMLYCRSNLWTVLMRSLRVQGLLSLISLNCHSSLTMRK